MFNHIGMLTLTETATAGDRAAIATGLTGLVGQIDGLVSAKVATDLGLTEGNAGVVFILEFASEQAWREYGAHPAHKAVIASAIAPVLQAKAFIQADGFVEARA